MTVLESIINALKAAAVYNRHDMASPRAVLWTDQDRVWEPIVDQLRASLPHLWTLGDYCPEKNTGPAAYLRFQLGSVQLPPGNTPILYLPGVGRSAFRSAADCPPSAIHLYALQFESQFWSQRNGRDWTPLAYLSSDDGGLGLEVAGNSETKAALLQALPKLTAVRVETLTGHALEATDFHALLAPDPVRMLLQWIGAPAEMRAQWAGAEWNSFRSLCKETYKFDPDSDGDFAAVEKLAAAKGEWATVWARFKEAARAYPGVAKALRRAVSPEGDLFSQQLLETYPVVNQVQEESLRSALEELENANGEAARQRILKLSELHLPRCKWVWSELGDAPLANALAHLYRMVKAQELFSGGTSCQSLSEGYRNTGWKVDAAALDALSASRNNGDAKAISAVLRSLYGPWLERLANDLQSCAASYPNRNPDAARKLTPQPGTLFLFVDGLRFDVAQSLAARLDKLKLKLTSDFEWAALPTVTATAKPAWQPMASHLQGSETGAKFEAQQADNKPLTTDRFRELMQKCGIRYLEAAEVGDPKSSAWTEIGKFDTYGHDQGWKLAWRIEEELSVVTQRIQELLDAGWKTIRVLTDHGWLLLPGGLPKQELPKHLTVSRWGRCASPETGAQHGFKTVSWFWNNNHHVVLAPGISCFVAGKEYSHGGLTLQETLLPVLEISNNHAHKALPVIQESGWHGLRLKVKVNKGDNCRVDLRLKAGSPQSSLVAGGKGIPSNGEITFLLESDELLGSAAFLVILDSADSVLVKKNVTVGED